MAYEALEQAIQALNQTNTTLVQTVQDKWTSANSAAAVAEQAAAAAGNSEVAAANSASSAEASQVSSIASKESAAASAAAASASESSAAASAAAAASSADSAASAADAAQLSAGVYADTAAGLSATADGDYFSVPSTESDEYLILYLNSSGSAIEQKRYPAVSRITALEQQVEAAEDGIVEAATALGSAWSKQRSYRSLLGGFDDAGEAVEIDAAGNLVGGPPVIAQLAGEAEQGQRAYQAAPKRALLGGFDDAAQDQIIDNAGNIVDGPIVIQQLADEVAQSAEDAANGAIAYRASSKRALLGGFDDLVADLIVDGAGNLVGGPVVIEALLAGGGLAASEESRDAVYIEGGVLKIAASAGPQILADILPSQFVRSAQWRGPAVITAIDRPSLGSETPVAVAKLEDGYSSVIPSGRKLLIVIPSYGQSNSVGAQAYAPPAAMTANPWPDDLLMFDLASGTPDIRMGLPAGGAAVGAEEVLNGANLIGFRPLVSVQSAAQSNRGATALEAVGFTVQQVAADYLSYQPKVLMFAPGYGSRPLRDLDKGTIPYSNFITALTRAKALADAQGYLMYVPFIVFVHGEGDSTNVNYLADLPVFHADIQDDIKLITGQAGDIPLCHSQASTFFSVEVNGVLDPYKLSKTSGILSLSAPYYPYEFASDELHLGNRGLYLGEKMARTVLRDSKLWGAKGKGVLKPASVTFNGTDTIDLVLDVPVSPIVRDTVNPNVNNPAPDNWGFEVHDGSGNPVTISSVTILNSTTIRIVTASTPAAGASRALRYAMTGYPGLQNEGGVRVKGLQPRGQVRDSESTPSIVDGTPLYNWLVHFSENF